jgi:hypothetical protein
MKRLHVAARFWFALLPSAAMAGCFSPSFVNGKGPCDTNSDCAAGLHCAADKTCWHNGRDPDMSVSIAGADLTSFDLDLGGGPTDGAAPDSGPADLRVPACTFGSTLGTCVFAP